MSYINEKEMGQLVDNLEAKTDVSILKSNPQDQHRYAYNNNLAKLFYNFLSKKSDKLPSFKYVNAIIKKSDFEDFIISVGCGLFVIFDGIKLYVRYEEPLTNTIFKVEEFHPKKYDLKAQTYDGSPSSRKVSSSFEKERINVVLNYLKQYSNYIKLQENEKGKSKSK